MLLRCMRCVPKISWVRNQARNHPLVHTLVRQTASPCIVARVEGPRPPFTSKRKLQTQIDMKRMDGVARPPPACGMIDKSVRAIWRAGIYAT